MESKTAKHEEKGWKVYGWATAIVLAIFALLYLFICSLDLMGDGFKLLVGKTAGDFLSGSELFSNPIVGLMIGKHLNIN